MIPSPDVQILAQMIDPFNIQLLAPELGENCGVNTGSQAVAELFTHLVHGLINAEAFIVAAVAIHPDFIEPATEIVKACLGAAAGI